LLFLEIELLTSLLELYNQNKSLNTFKTVFDAYIENDLNIKYSRVYMSTFLKFTQTVIKYNYVRMQIINDISFDPYINTNLVTVGIV
jgi:hypothetical protein